MGKSNLSVKVLGCRGSVPVEGEEYRIYGGATSSVCMTAISEENGAEAVEEIYLDAGSGIVAAEPRKDSSISILISHMHLDHLCGLTFFPALSQKDRRIDIYAAARSGFNTQEGIDRLYSPPYWPLKLTDYPSNAVYHDLEKKFSIGKVNIECIEVNHPGGSTTYKLEFDGRVLVYAVDFEHNEEKLRELTEFARGSDLLIYDGQYTETEYPGCYGFGHSIPEIGLELAKNAGVKKILFTHHSPSHKDAFMQEWEEKIKKLNPNAGFAKAGMVVEI